MKKEAGLCRNKTRAIPVNGVCICDERKKAKESEEASRSCISQGEVGAIKSVKAKRVEAAARFLSGGREAVYTRC